MYRWIDLFLALSILLVAVVATMNRVKAQDKTDELEIVYRVVGAASDSTMERELNELSPYGCRIIHAISGTAGVSENIVILECPSGAPSVHKPKASHK